MKFIVSLLLTLCACTAIAEVISSSASDVASTGTGSRLFMFQYETDIPLPEGLTGELDIYIPLAIASDQQQIIDEAIESNIAGEVRVEGEYGNRFWHGRVSAADQKSVRITVRTSVRRKEYRAGFGAARLNKTGSGAYSNEALAQYLKPNSRVVVGHPILDPIIAEIRQTAQSDDPAILARAIYDWVVDNVEYKKIGSGWGNGDTFWACVERYGNCTDFHALYISLARSFGIPARFEIGFPVPVDRSEGEIMGYHCWVQLYLPGLGWLPVDASEAFKDPTKRDYFYGTHPSDRIHFSIGRDLSLAKSSSAWADERRLNYFVYPYVEINDEVYKGVINKRFSYQKVPPIKPLADTLSGKQAPR